MKKIERHIICERDVGLFSLVQQVISHIPLALSKNRYPVVWYGANCCYWTKNGYEGKMNVWEYYFEPLISDNQINHLSKSLIEYINSHPPNHEASGYYWDNNTFVSNNFGTHKDFNSVSLKIPFRWHDPDKYIRLEAKRIIQTYIHPRIHIVNKANIFFMNFMHNQHIIGVHIRATDVSDLRTEYNIYRRYSYIPERFISEVNQQINENQNSKIFVATDSKHALTFMEKAFADKIISYSSILHSSEPFTALGAMGWKMPGYLTYNKEIAAQNGEEAIIDYLLLSRCNYLIHNGSSLARTVLLKEPNMPHTNVHSVTNYLRHLLDPRTFEFYYFTKIVIQKMIWRTIKLLK